MVRSSTHRIETLVVDTSALLCRYLDDPRRELVNRTMARATNRIVTALARTEVLLALHQTLTGPEQRDRLWATVGSDWDNFWEIPVDRRCLATAADLGARYGLSLSNAVHLAAVERLGPGVTLLTFDRRQLPAASAMEIEVYTTAVEPTTRGLLAP